MDGVYPTFKTYIAENVTDDSGGEENTRDVVPAQRRGTRLLPEMGMNTWGEPLLLPYVFELRQTKVNIKIRHDIIRTWIGQHYSNHFICNYPPRGTNMHCKIEQRVP